MRGLISRICVQKICGLAPGDFAHVQGERTKELIQVPPRLAQRELAPLHCPKLLLISSGMVWNLVKQTIRCLEEKTPEEATAQLDTVRSFSC